MSGTVTTTDAAIIAPQGISKAPLVVDENAWIAYVTVDLP